MPRVGFAIGPIFSVREFYDRTAVNRDQFEGGVVAGSPYSRMPPHSGDPENQRAVAHLTPTTSFQHPNPGAASCCIPVRPAALHIFPKSLNQPCRLLAIDCATASMDAYDRFETRPSSGSSMGHLLFAGLGALTGAANPTLILFL